MKRMYFKNEAEYEGFMQAHPREGVWPIYGKDGLLLCDVSADDYFYLHEIGFIDQREIIVPNLTPEQIQLFKENYGVEIFIVSNRIELTKKQLEAVKKYNEAVQEMKDSNIICVFKPFEDILVFNGEYIKDISFEEDYCEDSDDVLISVDEVEAIKSPFGLNLSILDDRYVNVSFK